MRHIIKFLGISILFITIGCKKSPELATDYIPVFTGNVETNVSYKKVNFSASFNNLDRLTLTVADLNGVKELPVQIVLLQLVKLLLTNSRFSLP